MKIVNRGYIKVQARKPYVEWANQFEEEFFIDEDAESSMYLVEEDFFEIEPVLKANYKKIFTNELMMITEDESEFPPITWDNFLLWFDLEIGSSVFDCQKESLVAD